MASNDELKASILAIDENAQVDDLNNAQRVDLLKNLKEDPEFLKGDGDSEANADAEAKAKADAEKEVKLPPYTVKKRKAITTSKGIRADGDEIKVSDFDKDGQAKINAFVKSGHISKN